jgi:glycosyltransferase involved in cell wall biosynthesis
MGNSVPLISLVVPSYNQGQFIEKTLLSIFGQDYPKLRVLVLDGRSADQTVAVLRRHDIPLSRSTLGKPPDCAAGGNRSVSLSISLCSEMESP